LSRNSFEGAWLAERDKPKHLHDLDRVFR